MHFVDNGLLYLRDVHQAYPVDGHIKTIINGISLLVKENEFITVVGPSGSGKSTLLRMILGEEPPVKGEVLMGREVVDHPDRSRGIVFQSHSAFPHMTIQENAASGLIWEDSNLTDRVLGYFRLSPQHRALKRRALDEAATILEEVGLGDHIKKYPDQLSGGQRQRVAIAGSMIMKPKILLMDEPFGALDVVTREQMQDFIIRMFETNDMSIIFITHSLDEAVYLATRIWVISQFYEDDQPHEGSKIVTDIPVDAPFNRKWRESGKFAAIREQLWSDGLDPGHKQHVRDFNLSHPHSIRCGVDERDAVVPSVGQENI